MVTWLHSQNCNLSDLITICQTQTLKDEYPFCSEVVQNVLIYDAEKLELDKCSAETRRLIMSEFIKAFKSGPGIIVVRGMIDRETSERANQCFLELLQAEKEAGKAVGDHFGSNSRLWNSLEKMAVHDPKLFIKYYSNEVINTVSEAWLGPQFQMTAQVNLVHPGGQAQIVHRDFPLGHMEVSNSERYPAHMHLVCPYLTLQGAVAHCDWSIESGPTMFLPHS